MIQELRIKIQNIPLLILYQNSPEQAGKKGTILFYHGLGKNISKDTHYKELNSFAEKGYLAVAPDNFDHGERLSPDFDAKYTSLNPDFENTFIQAVWQTVEEVPLLINSLIEKGYTRQDKIAVSGISMGGYISFGAICRDSRIKVGVPILGNPEWKHNGFSPAELSEKFPPCSVLILTAGKDQCVPPAPARNFHRKLLPLYTANPDNLCYIEYPESGHFVLPHEWEQLWNDNLKWMNKL